GYVVKQAARVLKSTFPQSITIHTTIAADLEPVAATTVNMYQLLLNLCLNARDAMPSGGTLTIETRNITLDEIAVQASRGSPEAMPGKYVLLGVADTGTGIPAEFTDRIFEAFFSTK